MSAPKRVISTSAATESRDTLGSSLLAVEIREFGSSARIYNRSSILGSLVPGARPPIQLEEFSIVPVGNDVVLVTHRSQSVPGPDLAGRWEVTTSYPGGKYVAELRLTAGGKSDKREELKGLRGYSRPPAQIVRR